MMPPAEKTATMESRHTVKRGTPAFLMRFDRKNGPLPFGGQKNDRLGGTGRMEASCVPNSGPEQPGDVQIFSRISLAQSIWLGITPFLSLTLQMSGVISSTT